VLVALPEFWAWPARGSCGCRKLQLDCSPGFLGLHLGLVSPQVLPNAGRRSLGKYRRSFWYIVVGAPDEVSVLTLVVFVSTVFGTLSTAPLVAPGPDGYTTRTGSDYGWLSLQGRFGNLDPESRT
jgi:hypothetical protein